MTSAGGILLVVLGVWLGLQTMVGALPDKILSVGGTASMRQPPPKQSSGSSSESGSSKTSKPKSGASGSDPYGGHTPYGNTPGLPGWATKPVVPPFIRNAGKGLWKDLGL